MSGGMQLYPPPRRERRKARRQAKQEARPWAVRYDLAYDGGGSKWDGYYRTRFGAQLAAFWNVRIASWGGTAVLRENKAGRVA